MAGKWYSKEEKPNTLSECDQGNASVKENIAFIPKQFVNEHIFHYLII
ncbi:hypothetical protein [Bacillus atrophaeus]|nr:hypothetical protein [Bacillus atrophaeus]KYD03730.1 hypothetical protein B4144_4007 [Bacillus atrophaeus]MEC0766467.1 hypothetical protein [Bacillus atrophaeus]MEC0781115.1 hypothetical protein [Bacillus atrophaeus]MEC0806746.1 hypothetical protein [Bacillus atrophaeus]